MTQACVAFMNSRLNVAKNEIMIIFIFMIYLWKCLIYFNIELFRVKPEVNFLTYIQHKQIHLGTRISVGEILNDSMHVATNMYYWFYYIHDRVTNTKNRPRSSLLLYGWHFNRRVKESFEHKFNKKKVIPLRKHYVMNIFKFHSLRICVPI